MILMQKLGFVLDFRVFIMNSIVHSKSLKYLAFLNPRAFDLSSAQYLSQLDFFLYVICLDQRIYGYQCRYILGPSSIEKLFVNVFTKYL